MKISVSAITQPKVSKEQFLSSAKTIELLEKKFKGIFNRLKTANSDSLKTQDSEISTSVVEDLRLLQKLLDKYEA